MICKDYEKSIELIHEFFNIQPSEKFGEEIFWTLKKIISFTSGYIFFTNPTRLEYSYNGNSTTITDIKQPYLEEENRTLLILCENCNLKNPKEILR